MAAQLPEAIAAALARGATILTPTERAARTLRRAFDQQQWRAGRRLWSSPAIQPLEFWLGAEWHRRLLDGTETRMLLNRTQEQTLWREIIQADPETPRLRSADALATLAARAWSLLYLHSARARVREFPLSTDSRAFERWSRTFERRLQRAQLITPAELPAALAAHPGIANLILVDFDQLPAATDRLMRLLEAGNLQTGDAATEISHHASEDDAAELEAAARWIRERLKQDPEQNIAVVVPNLADRRSAIDRAFGPILAPASLPITAPAAPPLYEFSLGRPLAELPLATVALDLLTWLLEPLSLDRIGNLILSPWLTLPKHEAAAEFDARELRQLHLLRPELTLERTLILLNRSPRREALAPLLANLRRLEREARAAQFFATENRLRQPYGAWAGTLRTLLEAAGWTARATLTSLLFQQHRRFDSALDELATLDALPSDELRRPTAAEALAAFTRILRQTVFAPESTGAPVQVLGPLEVGGIPFDALWFFSADDLTWPPPAAANPLVPWQLQRALSMPGADRTHDDALAQALTTRIAHSAATTVFSYAIHSDEGERRASPLIAPLNPSLLIVPVQPSQPPAQAFEEVLEDAAVSPLPDAVTRGGSRILQLQAACAFRAFAETRLQSAALANRPTGLNPMERGSIVHHVMESFWTTVDSQESLRNLTAAERGSILIRAIDSAMEQLKARPETRWDEAYLAIQRKRLETLLTPWLESELERGPFTVLPPEERRQLQLGPLTLDLRIDRVDVTPAGHLILDYKTGDATPASWRGDRPDEPQLPVYAVLAEQLGCQLAGVAFALLRPGTGMGLKGYSEDPTLLPKAATMEAPSLAEQVAQWRETLTILAEAYAAGDSRVEPKLYPTTCERCDQRILCRLNPATLSESASLAVVDD